MNHEQVGGAADDETPRPGSRIESLHLIRQVGEGKQGVVFEGRDVVLGRRVAVKVLSGFASLSPANVERFRRGAQAAARLNHPGIVGTYDFIEWKGHSLIVQEFVEGQTLEQFLEARRDRSAALDEAWFAEAAELVAKLAEALEFAHRSAVIHRDVKPANVLLDADGQPKLADFGLARILDEPGLSQTGDQMGTPNYMSPEQVRGEPGRIGARTDVYSLGVMLYVMLAGRLPFRGQTLDSIFMQILMIPAEPVRASTPSVPRDLEAVCLKAIEKFQGDRYASAGDFAQDLRRFLAGEPTAARPLGPLDRFTRRLRRHPAAMFGLMAALLAVLWVVCDRLLLRDLADAQREWYYLRLGVVPVAALVIFGPLALLLGRGRRLRIAGAVAALVLVSGAAWPAARSIRLERKAREKAELEQRVNDAGAQPNSAYLVGSNAGTSDLGSDGWATAMLRAAGEYAARWPDLLDLDDCVLLAGIHLENRRLIEAQDWMARAEATNSTGPLIDGVRAASLDVLGRADEARLVEARLWAYPAGSAPAQDWRRIGDTMRSLGRFDAALEAYRRVGSSAGADLMDLDIRMAEVYAALCRWEEARPLLTHYREPHFQDDPRGLQLEIRLALARPPADLEAASGFLDRLEANPRVPRGTVVHHRSSVQQARGEEFDLHGFSDAMQAQYGDDLSVLEELAVALWGAGPDHRPEAERLFDRLLELDASSVVARVGLAAAAIQKGRQAESPTAERRDHFATARALALEAIGLNPDSTTAYFNLAVAYRYATELDHGPRDGWSAELLQGLADAYEECLRRDGLHFALNNYALAQCDLFELTQDPRHLDLGIDYIRRALHLTAPPAGSQCAHTGDENWRVLRSRRFDTLSSLLACRADLLPEALEAARQSRDTLWPSDTDYEKRVKAVQELELRVAAR